MAGLYAFARAVDDLVDEPPPTLGPDDVLGQLAAWRGWLEQPTSLAPPDPALAARVTPALLAHGVPPAYLQMLVDGVASDLTRAEIRSWSELRAYCVLVASSVGLAMCHLLGAGDDPLRPRGRGRARHRHAAHQHPARRRCGPARRTRVSANRRPGERMAIRLTDWTGWPGASRAAAQPRSTTTSET